MAKVDKSQYTKSQWRIVREQRRRQKELDRAQKAQKKLEKQNDTERTVKVAVNEPTIVHSVETPDQLNYIVCLKHGAKYSADYVNRLYNMTKRHCTVPFTFVCFTDDIRDINPDIHTISLKHIGVYGWWYKPIFFDKAFPLNGNILYFDLDIVIHKNIDNLFTYNPGKFLICRDFNRSIRSDWARMNSSVFRLVSGSLGFVYDKFMENAPMNMRRFHGDQDWIYEMLKDRKNLSINGYLEITLIVSNNGSIKKPVISYKGIPEKELENSIIFDVEDEILNICRTFSMDNKKQQHNLIETLKQNCRRIIREKTGKKPFTNINIARI